jgi:two-component system, LuxR family, response regulator FixJ
VVYWAFPWPRPGRTTSNGHERTGKDDLAAVLGQHTAQLTSHTPERGLCDDPMSVRALRQGAVDFLEKPYEPQKMLEVVQEQLLEASRLFTQHRRRQEVRSRLETLTPREREVLRLVISGLSSQVIARRLGTSVKTVDVHRARIKSKTGSETLVTLVRDVLQNQITV